MPVSAAANPSDHTLGEQRFLSCVAFSVCQVVRVAYLSCSWYVCRVSAGLKKALWIAVLERSGFDRRIHWFHVDGGLICVENICGFINIRDLPQVVLAGSTAEKAVKRVGRAV